MPAFVGGIPGDIHHAAPADLAVPAQIQAEDESPHDENEEEEPFGNSPLVEVSQPRHQPRQQGGQARILQFDFFRLMRRWGIATRRFLTDYRAEGKVPTERHAGTAPAHLRPGTGKHLFYPPTTGIPRAAERWLAASGWPKGR